MHLLFVFWKLLPVPLLYVSRYFERNRDTYCGLLFEISASGAWRDWINFFLDAVCIEALDTADRIKALNVLQSEWHERLKGVGRSDLPSRLTKALFEAPYVTIPLAAKILDVTYTGAKRAVDRLVDTGILVQLTPSSYNRVFVAHEVFDIITV
jgi:Fic family protein